MNFSEFAKFLQYIESITSRNEISVEISKFFKLIGDNEIDLVAYFIVGRLGPEYEMIEFNFSEKQIINTITKNFLQNDKSYSLFNLDENSILNPENIQAYLRQNDVDEAIYKIRSLYSISPINLSIKQVYDILLNLVKISGKGSQEKKSEIFWNLFISLDAISIKYVTRIILGKLRTGFGYKTLIDAMSYLFNNDKRLSDVLENKFGFLPDIGKFIKTLLNSYKNDVYVIDAVNLINPEVFIPILPKLVERESNVDKVFERIPVAIVQPKLDGLRGQIHVDIVSKKVKIFSRNLEDLTDQFPEIVQSSLRLNIRKSVIIDSEIIGFDFKTENFLSYQQTMTRRRKYNVEEYRNEVPVVAMCFDLLFLDGKDLTQEPLSDRIQKLQKILDVQDSTLRMLETKLIDKKDSLNEYFNEQLNKNLEGIIIKDPKSTYEPGTRNFKWIKLKANTVDTLVDTIDVVVMGYYYGKGSRNKFGFGALLVGVLDEDKQIYTSLAKLGSGFTEEFLTSLYSELSKIEVSQKPDSYEVSKEIYPDVWVSPKIILEIVADEITRSPIHTTGANIDIQIISEYATKGLSVRFPRFKRIRNDKSAPTTVKEVIQLYKLRKSRSNFN